MLEKEVKQYKRGNSFTYRIDLSKKDNFEGGEKVMLLTLNEYNEFNDTIENFKNQLDNKDNIISDLREQNNNIKSDISKEIDKRNDEISKKNNEIKNLMDENQKSLQKCYDIIDEKDKAISQSNEEIRLERIKSDEIVKNTTEEIRLERERNDNLITSKNKEIKSLNSQLNSCLQKDVERNNILTAYRLLIERYKSRSFIDRLLNREPSETDLNVGSKDTYILETEKKE
jgi:exonuclease SbcC